MSDILRPNADVSTGWGPIPGPAHWSAIDDAVVQPTAGDTSDSINTSANATDEVALTTAALPAIEKIDVWVYAATNDTITVSLRDGTTQFATGNLNTGGATQWVKVCTYTGSLTQAQVDDLRIRFVGGAGFTNAIYTAYTEVFSTADKTSEVSNQTRSRRPMPMFRGPDVDRRARELKLR